MFGEALAELRTLGQRKAAASGDGFADNFPIQKLAAALQSRLERPQLGKADWVAFAVIGRPKKCNKMHIEAFWAGRRQ